METQGFGEIVEGLRRATVEVNDGGRGGGSGIVWNAGGLIVTNAHVARTERARVRLWDGRAFDATVEGRDARRDLAALRVPAAGLPAAPPADSDAVRPGQVVLAAGNPLGFIGALTTGVVHALGVVRGLGRKEWVQSAIRLAPGNSGGPLADALGRIIGVNTMITGHGLALAVPSNAVSRFLEGGRSAARARLGVTVRPVRARETPGLGLLVLELERGGPAATASLTPGDVLITANGEPFDSPEDLADWVANADGGVLRLEFLRQGHQGRRSAFVSLTARSTEAA